MTKYLINNVETTKEYFFERLEEQVQLKAQDNVDKIVDLESEINDNLEMFGDYTINGIYFKIVES